MTRTPLSDVYARFCDLLSLAEGYLAIGDLSAAVRLAQLAAFYAFCEQGLFASPRLERLLLEIGKQIPTDSPCGARNKGDNSRNVLHVLTHAKPVGGDSRFAWRWMQRDGSSRHSVAITTQDAVSHIYEIPKVLSAAAENSGGFVRALDSPSSKPLEQARELRRLCQKMDVVALHLYPYDVIPVLALAAGCDSVKTVFVNHSDHTFWIGASVAHSVLHLRSQSAEFLRERRGLDPDQSSILPIPLVPPLSTIGRAEAKRALGYGPDAVLLLTIASKFKYSSPDQIGFLELVTPVLLQYPQAVVVAVGPILEGDWRSANTQTNGRVVALGRRWDTDLFYAAADVYLDSVPFSSITSLLEAGSHGIPLLGRRFPDPALHLLGPGAPGLDDTMELATDTESYRTLLARLIEDAEFRHQIGQRVKKRIISLHTGSNWMHSVQDAYVKVEQTAERRCLVGKNDIFERDELSLALFHLYSSVPLSFRGLIRRFIGILPYRPRLAITWRLHRIGFGLCWLNLLPPPLDTLVHRIGRWVKGAMMRRPRLR